MRVLYCGDPMADDIYRSVLRDFAHLAGLGDQLEETRGGSALLVHGIALTIHHACPFGSPDPGEVHVYVDFGPFPEARGLEILRRLLEVNLLLASPGTARLGIDAYTGRVVLAYRHELQDLTAGKLHESVTLAAQQALAWRADFYLDAPSPFHADLRDAIAA